MNATRAFNALSRQRNRRDWSDFVFATWALFFAIRLLGSGWRQGFAIAFPDSSTFLTTAALGPFSTDFWLNDRPAGLPLVLWLLQSNTQALILLQTVLYIASSIFLFRTILNAFSTRIISWTCVALSALVLSHYKFAMWNLEVLSESLIISSTILCIALLIRISQSPTKHEILGFGCALVFLLLLRDINLVLVAGVLPGAYFCYKHPFFKEHRKNILQVALLLTVASIFVLVTQSESQRFKYGIINNVGLRVLPNNAIAEEIFENDKQVLALLDGRAGKTAWDDNEAFLKAPSLQPFRDWVNTNGRSEIPKSVVTQPSFWASHISDGMRSALSNDVKAYDRFNSSTRLVKSPDNGVLPTSPLVFIYLLLISGFSAFAGARFHSKNGLAIILPLLLGVSLLFFAISVLADAVEVQQHSIPPLLLSSLCIVFGCSLLVDSALASFRPTLAEPRSLITLPRLLSLCGGGFLVVTTMSLVALEFRTQDWDPSFARTIIERVSRFGGTYYQNGIWHHGPLDALLYDIPRFFTSYGTYWFGVAAIAMMMALAVAYSTIRISQFFGTRKSISLALGIAIFLHLTISSSDYAGVIYSRNTTTTFLMVVFAFALTKRPWSSSRTANYSFIISFVVLGLAVQTMVSAIVTAVAVGTGVYLLHRKSVTIHHPALWASFSFFIAIASAPTWYFLRGSLSEFWDNWWVMARHMSTATNRTIIDQFSLGWDKFYEYYKERPVLLIIVLCFLFVLRLNWQKFSAEKKIVGAITLAWFIAAWCELAISQRYSSHYFIIPTIPTAIMLAVIASHLFPTRPEENKYFSRSVSLVPAVLVASIMLVVQCSDLFWSGVEGLSRFQSFKQHQQFVADTRSGETKTIRAVLDLASSENDGLLAWTMFPWTYLEHQRVPATRLSWKSFMLGEIYLANQSDEYVLPDTWKWFAADMKQSEPNAYLHPTEIPFVDNTPFAAYVADNFEPVMETEKHTVSLRKSVWAPMVTPADAESSFLENYTLTKGSSPATLSISRCVRIDTLLVRPPDGAPTSVEFTFHQSRVGAPHSTIRIDAGQIQTLVNGYPQHSRQVGDFLNENVPISILVGSRSAAVLVGGRIATAVRLLDPSGVTVASLDGSFTLKQTSTSAAPYLNQCQ